MARKSIYHNDITQDYEQVQKENKTLVKEFIQYCKSNDKSPQTIKQYEHWLKIFFCWNLHENEDKLFPNLRKRDFTRYIGYLRDLGFSPNRIAALKSALSAFSNEIELLYEDVYPNFRNQLRGLEAVHITTVREKTVMSTKEVEELLNKLVEGKYFQEACYLALVCASGARKAELLQMKTAYFCPETEVFNGYMYVTPSIRSKGRGKIGKLIKKYAIKSMFKPYFDLWMEERAKLGIENEWLFLSKKNGVYTQATVSTANTIAAKISQIANNDFYSHSGRHYFCTLLKSMHLPDDVIVQIFSWAGSEMIKIYDDTPAEERLNNFFANFNSKDDAKGE